MRLRFGLYAFPFDLAGVVAEAGRAEECGFDVLATGDHIRHPRDPGVAILDGWSVLANWAAHTQKVRLAMLVSNLIYRNPVLLAKQAVAIDQLSNGRLDLGIGTGVYETDHLMAGVPEWSPGEKVGRFGEALEIVDALLRGAMTEYEGRYYRFEQASVSPGPVQNPRPPLIVGAEGPRTLRLAARYADRWMSFGGFASTPEEYEASIENRIKILDQHCQEIGRDPDSITRSLFVFRPLEPWRSRSDFESIVKRFSAIGFAEFILPSPGPDQLAVFDRVVTEIIPQYQRG
ncbi:MAG: LLM class flavin-dependent oxidoreductase [Acidimicrobiia bacterium]|nr:LLM class flavin-dependent oxidoreductase [Acidimicrobiia bacterium]